MSREHVIPVAFEVRVENGVTEHGAAKKLAEMLGRVKILDQTAFMPDTLSEVSIDSWWMPNHPAADGSDREAILIWVPMMSYAGRVTPNETPQQSVDRMLGTMRRWANE